MLVVVNRLSVAEGYEDEFIQRFEQQLEQIRKQEGLERVEILAPIESDHHVIKAYWNSEGTFERWRDSEAFQKAHADIPSEMFTEPNQLTTYKRELVVTSNGLSNSNEDPEE